MEMDRTQALRRLAAKNNRQVKKWREVNKSKNKTNYVIMLDWVMTDWYGGLKGGQQREEWWCDTYDPA